MHILTTTHPPIHHPKPRLLAASVLLALAAPALAQSAGDSQAADLDAVTVTGIRGSLQSSMNLKRDFVGVMDGIIAEDIGKFPDTNLAESMQRISGVSIDRTLSGEGSRVTVRGIGADFNLVLLNGRQMPASSLGANGANISGSRAFDFANLASEAVSGLEVYKTANADIPTGGIGASINIKTARPLDNPGLRASVGVKGMMDRSVNNLPHTYPGKSITPEISGIFSNTFADGRFGIALNGSYQERDGGFSRVRVNDGWLTFRGDDGDTPFRLPLPDEPEYADYAITNRPGPDAIYARPRNLMYLVSSEQRQRRNGQAALQFAPTDNITATLDYTYADNRIQQQRSEFQIIAFSHGPGASSWTDGPVSAPIIYSEYGPNGDLELSTAGAEVRIRSELKSLGLNVEWQVNDSLDLALDYHDSVSETRPDSVQGSANFIETSVFVRGDTTVDFSGPLPILNFQLGPGVDEVHPSQAVMRGVGFRGGLNRAEVKQGQLSGTFRFADYQALDFGIASTETSNRATFARASGAPGLIGGPDDFDDDIWYADNMGKYFRQFKGHNDPRFTDRTLIFDFQRLRDRAIEITGREDWYTMPGEWSTDQRINEKTRSAYLQWRNSFDWTFPVSVSAGMRYEHTDVSSPSLIRPPVGNLIWDSTSELRFDFAGEPVPGDFTGEYHYWLPSLDIRVDLRENLVLRNSYSKSIGRARWDDLQGGLSVIERYQILGGNGNLGNPGLLPVQSKNIDLSLEWYYGAGSYASLGYFRKNIKNFVGTATLRQSPWPMYSPIGGAYWNEALAVGGCQISELNCIRNYIFANHDGDPGVDAAKNSIIGQPGDPLAEFAITTKTNQRSDTLDGWELNLQHMFGDSGFGVAFNYTKVDSGLVFDDYSLGEQYPMVGLSDSGNLVLFYDKYGWQIRAAYNWRDEFLNVPSGSIGSIPDPEHTQSYGQLDVNVTWAMNEHLSLFVEGINLTDETQRTYGRHRNMLRSASQSGPRYMFGARYKF